MIANSSVNRMDIDVGSLPRKLVECRICHDDDEDLNMEIPCSCSGSLKKLTYMCTCIHAQTQYAHRRCVQRWCNEKGDTICEICRQHFKPGYSAPSPLSRYGSLAINLRGSWEIVRDLPNTEFIGMVATNNYLFNPDLDDYSEPDTRRLICCRIVAIIFTVLLVLRHTLPIIISAKGEYSARILMLLTLKILGILLPIYIIVKAFTAIQRRRHHEDFRNILGAISDEENEQPLQHPQPQFIRAR